MQNSLLKSHQSTFPRMKLTFILFSECLPIHPKASLTTLSLTLHFLSGDNTPRCVIPANWSHQIHAWHWRNHFTSDSCNLIY